MSDSSTEAGTTAAPLYFGPGSLRGLNTFGVDAHALRFARLHSVDQLSRLCDALRAWAEANPDGHRPLMLGGGSNLLIARVLDEPVVQIMLKGRRVLDGGSAEDDGTTALVELAAGESWDGCVDWSIEQGLCGLENLALIPGTAGAAPWQNIGAYGVEIGEFIDSVEALNWRSGEHRRFNRAECGFGYRDSFFKREGGRDWLILSIRLRLHRELRPRLDYGEIRSELERMNRIDADSLSAADALSAAHIASAVRSIRRRKLPDPAVTGNAGSFFKNPIVASAVADALRGTHPDAPAWPLEHGGAVKLSAGWLIERAGLKGHREGDAGVSDRHALVLVNHGRASGAELLAVAALVQRRVHERFGVQLEPEPVVLA